MDSLKAFLKEKGLYLVCLGLILAATVASIWAIRNVMRGVEQLNQQTLYRRMPHGTSRTQP